MGKVLWSTTSVCASVPGSSRLRPLTPDLEFLESLPPPNYKHPVLKNIMVRSARALARQHAYGNMPDIYSKIELVYFDIHARGEVVRLLFAAANRTAELTDTRVPLFFESPAATKEWTATDKPRSPLGYDQQHYKQAGKRTLTLRTFFFKNCMGLRVGS